jgi:omega-amidase
MKIAAAQMACTCGDVAANMRKIRLLAEQAKQDGAEWIVFPEMSDTGYAMSVIRDKASFWSGGAVPELCRITRELALGIVCGVSERDGPAIFNSQVTVDSTGNIIGKYRKTHLFEPAPVEEHKCFAAGAGLVVASMGRFRAGLSICYDLRFPEFYRALACEEGANLFILSSAWPFLRLEHLRILTRARAIENQSYLVLSNRVGTDEGIKFCGNSAIIDPSGTIIALASSDGEELVQAEISAVTIEEVRQRMPVFEHRRPELYRNALEFSTRSEGWQQ